MKILSLFDGMSCGQIALDRLGIKDYTYYSSEIDEFAKKVTQENYPNTIQIGDVEEVDGKDYKGIDLLMGGSPCQGFSKAGKQYNFKDRRSKLFFEYVRILNKTKPKYFLLENVKMKKEYQDIITEYLHGVEPVEINSSLLSAQNRKRLYWIGELQEDGTYKQVEIEQPQDKGILLKDVIEDEVDEKYNLSEKQWEKLKNYESNSRISPLEGKSYCLDSMQGGHRQPKINYPPGTKDFKKGEWNSEKSYTLCAREGKDPKIIFKIPEGTKKGFIEVKEGDLVDLGCLNSKTRRGRLLKDKSNCITTSNDMYKVLKDSVRKLIPLECERLQTIPDGFTSSVSDSQRYKMIGNGFTVDVIAHILKNLYN